VNEVPLAGQGNNGPGKYAFVVRAAMRLLARWLARRASVGDASVQTPLPVAVREARAILVVALAEIGDMVLLTVFLRGLRRLAPSARVTLVCLPSSYALFESSTDVDDVIAYAAAMPRLLRPLMLPGRARRFAERRLVGRFDIAVVPRWDTDHHLATAVALYSQARRRVWHSERANGRKRTLNAGFDALFTDVVPSLGVAHEVERHHAMLRAMGALTPSHEVTLSLTDDDRRLAADAMSAISGAGPLVAVGIGAAHPKRRWPVASFVQIGEALAREHEAQLVVVGGPADVEAQTALLRALGPRAIGLAGRLTLRQSAAVLERCRLFIGSDSAPMHLAAAAGVPCVEISCHPVGGDPLHNNAPERFAPWGVPSAIVRPSAALPPCTVSCAAEVPHCILTISPMLVREAAATLLQSTGAAGPRGSGRDRI
jgi:heptosyltransferase-2